MRKILVALPLLALFACGGNNDSDIVFVQNMKLYSEFDLALELDAELQEFSKSRTRELDSLTLSLENMTSELEQMEEIPVEAYQAYNDLRNAVMFREKNFEEELIVKSQEYDQQIWERLNGYVKNYAEEKEYSIVLGASGNGNLMYAKDALDITEDLITYCNKQYSGTE